jgi:hypothetical protein
MPHSGHDGMVVFVIFVFQSELNEKTPFVNALGENRPHEDFDR